jgi:GcrA cell cycle regulator
MSEWTESRIATLRRLWGLGWTASTIARELGGVTRNAVMGKAHRLGLTGRPSPIKSRDPAATEGKRQASRLRSHGKNRQQQRHAMQAAIAKSDRTASQRAAQLNGHAAEPVKVTTVTNQPNVPARLSRDCCAWPIGDPKVAGFHFCQAKPVRPGSAYCEPHYQRSIAPRQPESRAESEAA